MKRIEELFGQALDQAVPETWTTLNPAQLSKLKEKFAELIIEEVRARIVQFTLRYDDRASFNIQEYERMLHHELDDFKKELINEESI